MNIQQAQKLAEEEISKDEIPCSILESETIEKDWGWVFFYQSKSYIETKDFRQMLGGNAPLIINKNTAEISLTGTAYPVEYYIKKYESTL